MACQSQFKPASTVEGLRVLGMRAEPAEVSPGQVATLTALVVDPSAPTRRNTLVWISCDPDPFDLGRSACSDLGALSDSSSLFSGELGSGADGGTPSLPPGMKLAGFGPRAFYSPPADLFAALDPSDSRRQTGTVAQLLLLAIAEEISPAATQEELNAVLARVQSREVASLLAIFRLRVSEAPELNRNPVIGDLLVDGVAVSEGAHLFLTPGRDVLMRITAPPESQEAWDQPTPDGAERRTERLIAALYSTAGRFTFDRVAVNENFDTVFRPPTGDEGDPLPERARRRFWVVVRDTRGGQSWREHPVHFCEDEAEVPAVMRATVDGATLTLQGARLDRILDVLVGQATLKDGAWSPKLQKFIGTLPDLPAGAHPIRVRTVDCVDLPTGLTHTVQ